MSNNKPHFSYINVSLLVLSTSKTIFKFFRNSTVGCTCIMCGIFFWMAQKMILGLENDSFGQSVFTGAESLTSKIWISRCVVDIKLRSYSFVSRIRTLVKTLRHHVTILDLFRTLLDPSYYMIHINIVLNYS